MEALASIFEWLSDHEAGISAVVGIAVLAGIVFAGVRWIIFRGAAGSPQKLLVRPGRRAILIAAPAAVLLLAGVIAWLLLPDTPATEITSEEAPLLALPTGPVVAVLPFENLSGDPEQEYFSDGLTDDIITELSRFKDLFVIAQNSTLRYKGRAVDVRQLRNDLGAHYVLEGSVQKVGNALRATAQLLDAKDGTHLWADSYDRELSAASVFDVQDEISEHVVATIAGSHGVISRARFAEIRKKPTGSLAAYEWVLKAQAYDRDNWSAPAHAQLRDGLEQAVESAPDFADAWAWLSIVYVDEHKFSFNVQPDPLGRALTAARRAVSLEPSSQVAHHALANVYFFQHEIDAFLREMERTIALNPNHAASVVEMGNLLLNMGDERGITFVRKAVALDPLHPTWFIQPIAQYHFDRGEYDEALAAARKADVPGDFWQPLFLAVIYAELGREKDARSAVEELLRRYPGFTVDTYIEEDRKWNRPDAAIAHWAAALRKAGLPE